MSNDLYEKDDEKKEDKKKEPKDKKLVEMLSFRVVPAYFKEIEKVANKKNMTVSKLVRTYIKEGLKRDKEIDGREDDTFRVE